MNEATEKQKVKRNRSATCPHCNENFFSRKLRHKHVMLRHRKQRPIAAIRPVAELY